MTHLKHIARQQIILMLFLGLIFNARYVQSDNLPVFVDITKESGVDVMPRLRDWKDAGEMAFLNGAMSLLHSAGVGLEDLDLDGNLDLVIADVGYIHVFKGDGHGVFKPIDSGVLLLSDPEYAASGIAIGDIDGNGYPDIYAGVVNGLNHLFLNQKNMVFTEQAQEFGLADGGIAFSVNMVDYDNDGDVDIFISHYGHFNFDRLNINVQLAGVQDYPDDSYIRQKNALYRNDGGNRFSNVTDEAGLTAGDLTLASAFADYDHDGDQDLFVANDYGISRMYRNNGDGTFIETTIDASYINVGAGMSAMWGDVNNDGRFDLLVGNMYSHSAHHLMEENYASFNALPQAAQTVFERIVSGNNLYVQEEIGGFKDMAKEYSVDDTSWSWGSILADFNSDGWLDIYVANGWTRGKTTEDFCMTAWKGIMGGMNQIKMAADTEGIVRRESPLARSSAINLIKSFTQNAQPSEEDIESLLPFLDRYGNFEIKTEHISRLGDMSWDGYNKNALLVNSGLKDRPFIRIEESPVIMEDVSKTVATGDIDNDGDVDLVVVSQTSPVKIFRNDTPSQNWLKVILIGQDQNKSAIGARVIVEAGEKQWQSQIVSGSGFCSHQSMELEFGLGNVEKVDQIKVEWSPGKVQTVDNPSLNQRIAVREFK